MADEPSAGAVASINASPSPAPSSPLESPRVKPCLFFTTSMLSTSYDSRLTSTPSTELVTPAAAVVFELDEELDDLRFLFSS